MTGTDKPSKSSESEKARLERQSAALRENLRRRNAQRRARETGAGDSGKTERDSAGSK